MKILPNFVLLTLVVCLARPVFAQINGGSFFFQNESDSLVYDSDGLPLFGSEFVATLYGGDAPDSLSPATTSYFGDRLLDPTPFDSSPGRFNGRGVAHVETIGGFCGVPSWLQVRAWDTRIAPTYEGALALNIGGYGESELFVATGGNPCTDPPGTPRLLEGLESFGLRAVVPEPSTWALITLGGLGLWLGGRRRRK